MNRRPRSLLRRIVEVAHPVSATLKQELAERRAMQPTHEQAQRTAALARPFDNDRR